MALMKEVQEMVVEQSVGAATHFTDEELVGLNRADDRLVASYRRVLGFGEPGVE